MAYNKRIGEQSLTELLQVHKKDIFLTMNCHAVGVIESFNMGNQTVTAKIAYKKSFYNKDYEIEAREYPVLVDCPCVTLSGGNFSLKMPIKKGDECLVFFNDRCIDEWFDSGQIKKIESPRLHSFSDAIILVGIKSNKSSISGFEANKVKLGDSEHELVLGNGASILKKGSAKVQVKSKINISNPSEDLNTLLQDLITEIKNITVLYIKPTGPAVIDSSGPPQNAAALNAIAARIGSLLE